VPEAAENGKGRLSAQKSWSPPFTSLLPPPPPPPSLLQDLVVLLVGADHIKFGLGAPARLERLLRSAEVETAPGRGKVKSILLNPTPADTGSETRRLRLSLVRALSGPGGGVGREGHGAWGGKGVLGKALTRRP
jgi:hypothetical protein